MASSQPPPRAKPLTAATTGLPSFSMRSRTPCPRSDFSLPPTGVCCASSAMSAPATKAFSPAPVSTTPRTSASAPSAVKQASSSSITLSFRAFSFSGLLMVTTATPSRASTRRWSKVISGPSHQPGQRPRRLLAVVVEALAGLAAEQAGLHHALEERRRREAFLPELVEHDVRNVVGRVVADEIQERQRPHWMTTAELHAAVDVLDRPHPLLEGADRVE